MTVPWGQYHEAYKEIAERLKRGAIWTHFSKTASGNIISPSSGKRLRLLVFFFSSNADIITSLRFSSTGDDMFPLQQKGAVGMNLIGAWAPQGNADEPLYAYLSGTGTMKGSVLTEEV